WVFPRVMHEYGHLLVDDAIVCVKARLDTRDDQPKLTCLELTRPELTAEGGSPVRIGLPVNCLTETRVGQLKQLLVEHPGSSPVFLHVGQKVLRLTDEFRVDDGNGLMAAIRELLGPNAVVTS
ncbi:MAG: DNA polymerase III subunit alpha, partial [Acidimicrobiales bacterium]